VPQTTALRWIDRLEECGLVKRLPDRDDSRRIYVELTDLATCRVELWLKATFRADPDG
jgi:DNA-binding MarR family transcriptional regulator